jgi:hypothetical protein
MLGALNMKEKEEDIFIPPHWVQLHKGPVCLLDMSVDIL